MMARMRTYLSFVRFSHSVFALPFALTGALLASRRHAVTLAQAGWIIVCMVTARSAAMGFNRLVDARFDAENPRTAAREIPGGAHVHEGSRGLRAGDVGRVCRGGVAAEPDVPVAIAGGAGLHLLVLAGEALHLGHAVFLGLAMAIAPVGGWLAAGGGRGWEPWLLGLAIGLWVGGFDVLYACQDLEVDRRQHLKSIPVRFGVPRSLWISRVMHVGAIACLALLGAVAGLGALYLAGVAAVAALLAYEQSLVSATDLSQVKRAFDLNGYVGILYFLVTAASVYLDRPEP